MNTNDTASVMNSTSASVMNSTSASVMNSTSASVMDSIAVRSATVRSATRTVEGRTVEGRAVEGRAVDGSTVDGSTVEGRVTSTAEGSSQSILSSTTGSTQSTSHASQNTSTSRYSYNPNHMESYFGYIATHQDAALLLTAQECKLPIVKPIMRRLLAQERHAIRSGSVYVFNERDSGMKRWTDGMRWSKSRVEGQFLCYKRMDFDTTATNPNATQHATTMDQQLDMDDQDEFIIAKSNSMASEKDERLNILWKKCFAIDIDGSVCHVVNYYTKRDVLAGILTAPQSDPRLKNIDILPKFINPENFRLHTRPLSNITGPSTTFSMPNTSSTSSFDSQNQNVLVGFTISAASTHNTTSTSKTIPPARKYISAEIPTIIPSSRAETLVLQKQKHEKYVTCHKRHDPQLMRINLPHDFKELVETVCQSFQLSIPFNQIQLTKLNQDLVTEQTFSSLESGDILQISRKRKRDLAV